MVLPYINMNPPQVYTCFPSWTPHPPPSAYHTSGLSQCTSPKHPVSCIEPGLVIRFIYDIIHVSMPFPKSSYSLPLPQSPKDCSIHLCLFCCLTYRVIVQFSSFQSLSRVQLFATPWIAAHQASLSITNSQSSLRLTSIEPVMPSSHFVVCHPLLLLPPIPPSIRVFSNESTLHMRYNVKCQLYLSKAGGKS